MRSALDQAQRSRTDVEQKMQMQEDQHNSVLQRKIAGSVGPLFSSYRADTCPEVEIAAPIFAEMISEIEQDVDVILLETVPHQPIENDEELNRFLAAAPLEEKDYD